MMSGVITVSMNNHDADKFIHDGRNGFLAESALEAAEKTKYVINNPNQAKKISQKSRETAVEKFHINRYISEWHETIKALL